MVSFYVWKNRGVQKDVEVVDTEPVNWVSTERVVADTYKTSISLFPNLDPVHAIRIAKYFIRQRCKEAEIRRITILYTKKDKYLDSLEGGKLMKKKKRVSKKKLTSSKRN